MTKPFCLSCKYLRHKKILGLPEKSVFPTALRLRMEGLVADCKIKWSRNCHRHSFCSYMLELHGATVTAKMANHSEGTLFRHYANKVTRAEALKFSRLRPAA